MLASLLPLLDTPDEQARFTALYRRQLWDALQKEARHAPAETIL